MRSSTRSVPRLILGLCAFAFVWFFLAMDRRVPFAPSAPGSGAARFTLVDASGPVVWGSCDPVRVLFNPGPYGRPAFDEAVAVFDEVSARTGLRFDVTLERTLVPHVAWAVSPSARALGFPPPVLVGWVERSRSDMLRPSAAGSTVANPLRVDGRRVLLTGAIALDASRYLDFSDRSGAGMTRRNLLMHEIGHLLGLDHVDDRDSLMHPVVDERTLDGFSPAEVSLLRETLPVCR